MPANLIQQQLDKLSLGEVQRVHNLSVYPLLGEDEASPGYLTLDQALAGQYARITEVSEVGHVPELAFINLTEKPILLLDGEELIGAKQNRVLNVTILVPGNTRLVIPVSCVEMGRWARTSYEFASSDRTLYARARAAKMDQVSASMRSSGMRHADQGAIWDDIAVKMQGMRTESGTQAMSDIYEGSQARLMDYERGFHAVARQVGGVFAIGGRIVGLECFDAQHVFAAYLPKLVKSYALDAIEAAWQAPAANPDEDARNLLGQLSGAAQERYQATGLGEDVRLTGEGISGGALEYDGKLIHLAAYRLAAERRGHHEDSSSRLVRAVMRQRRFG